MADTFPRLEVLATGSSLLHLQKGSHDLSRRFLVHSMEGLSFREYLQLKRGLSLPVLPLPDLLADHQTHAASLIQQLAVAKSGSVHLDSVRNYLFLWRAPEGPTSIGKLIYAQDCHVQGVSGIVMPLNSKLQNTHIHFNNYESHFVEIAPDSDEIVIQEPSPSHPDEYWVLSGARPIFSWNQVTQIPGVPPVSGDNS